ncbi:MAG: hypothetical protein K8R73_06320 [Clostridiales bacterium]|nr:hypothetical protein [Clostridiales bacterium]
MKKIQMTIALYITIVLIMSVFFMPQNRAIVVDINQIQLDTITYRVFWDTGVKKVDEQYEYYSIDTGVHKLNLIIVSIVFGSIIAIQVMTLHETRWRQSQNKD